MYAHLQTALQAGQAVDDAHKRTSAATLRGSTASARELLDAASAAHSAAERATAHFSAASQSAAVVMPCSREALTYGDGMMGTACVEQPHARAPGWRPPVCLYNARALQLWVLGCCQVKCGDERGCLQENEN